MAKMSDNYKTFSQMAQKDPATWTKLTFDITSTIGAHGDVDKIELYAFKLGLKCQRRSTSGWFERQHVFILEGRADRMTEFVGGIRQVW